MMSNSTRQQLDAELDDLFARPQKSIRQERSDERKRAARASGIGASRVKTSSNKRPFGAWAKGTKYEQYYDGLYALARGGVHKSGARKGKRKNKQEEEAEQKAAVKWFRAEYPAYALCLHASAGGMFASVKTKEKMTACGYIEGTPDFNLAVPAWGKPGAYIEVKRDGGGTLSQAQKDVIAALKAQGYEVRVCHGFREFSAFVEWWMSGKTLITE